MIKLYI